MTDPYVRYSKLEVQPPPAPAPPKIVIRNSDGFPGLVFHSEDEALSVYMLLKSHFEGESDGEVD